MKKQTKKPLWESCPWLVKEKGKKPSCRWVYGYVDTRYVGRIPDPSTGKRQPTSIDIYHTGKRTLISDCPDEKMPITGIDGQTSTRGVGIHRGGFAGTTSKSIELAETLDELLQLIEAYCSVTKGMKNPAESQATIERAVRDRYILFYKDDPNVSAPPDSRDLQGWREHLVKEQRAGAAIEQTAEDIDSKGATSNTAIPSIAVEGRWICKSFKLLRQIDSDPKRRGISGDKSLLKLLTDWLKRRQKRLDIAETLYLKNGQIKTTMPHRTMFSEKN